MGRLFIIVLALLIGGAASAQEPKGWLGADVLDVTKAEAAKLGWDAPHGAKRCVRQFMLVPTKSCEHVGHASRERDLPCASTQTFLAECRA